MFLKLSMDQLKVNVNKVYINDAPELTLTCFTVRSNLVEIAYCAYTRSRCQVGVYMTIGPLLFYCDCA